MRSLSMNWVRSSTAAAILAFLVSHADAGTTFQYQGQIKQAGRPVTDTCDLTFGLWDAAEEGSLMAGPVMADGVAVQNGLFSVPLDFGASALAADEVWLEVSVRCPAGTGTYSTLAPRTTITAAPRSIHTRGLHVNESGYLVVGGTSPASPLHVADIGNWNWSVGNGWGDFSLNNGIVGLSFGIADAGGGTGDARIWTRGGLERLMFGNPTAADILTIHGSGRVGLGTRDPAYALHVREPTADILLETTANTVGSTLILRNNTSDPLSLGALTFVNQSGVSQGAIIYDAADRMTLYTNRLARVSIENDGRVGIGASDPQAMLVVRNPTIVQCPSSIPGFPPIPASRPAIIGISGTPSVTGGAFGCVSQNMAVWADSREGVGLVATTDGRTAIRAMNASGAAPTIEVTNTGGGLAAEFEGRVDVSGGSVMIGSGSPEFLLHVNGSAGKPGGGSWSVASDRRLKKNIQSLNHALDRLLSLRGVTFEYTDPQSIGELPGQRVGMIAQEVEPVFPDWVDEGPSGYRNVTFRGFEALTVEALRDLRAEAARKIAAQDAEIARLRGDNHRTQKRLARLESALAGAEVRDRKP